MFVLTWQNILIWSVVITVVVLLFGSIARLLKRFVKFWFTVFCLLVVFKIAVDAGWLNV